MDGVPVWVTCWRGLHGQYARVGGMGGAPAWVKRTVC